MVRFQFIKQTVLYSLNISLTNNLWWSKAFHFDA